MPHDPSIYMTKKKLYCSKVHHELNKVADLFYYSKFIMSLLKLQIFCHSI